MQQSPLEDSFAYLTRLSQKPGVQSTLILSRETGAIVRTSGLLSLNGEVDQDGTMTSNNGSNGYSDEQSSGKGKRMSAEDVARLVWNHTKVTADMTRELNGTQEDELKLMRVRTKRNELVIVPDAKFIAVVIHDTPPA